MRRRCSILLLLVAGVAWSQETETFPLTVFVRENNKSGRSMEGVQISAQGAAPTETQTNGKITLLVTEHRPGDDLEVAVYKEGYEVVNDLQRTVTLPRKPELHLFLCQPSRCLDERLSFYRLWAGPLQAHIEERYQKILKKIVDGLATADELSQMKALRDQALATVDRLTEELARLKPGEGSTSYRRAVQLFTEGKTEEALQELDPAKLDRDRMQARSEFKAAAKKLKDVTRAYIMRGQFLVTQFRLSEAKTAFEQAVATSPNDLDAAYALALFLAERNQLEKAMKAYKRGLKLARKLGNSAWVAQLLNNLGNLHLKHSQMEDSRKAFEEALQIRRKLAAQKPEVYLPDVATTLNSFGSLHRTRSQMVEAQKTYEEALKIRRQLADRKPDVYLPDVAETLNNIGILLCDMKQMAAAQEAYKEALEIYRRLADPNPNDYLPFIAGTLNNLGILHSDQNQMEDALSAFEEALESYRELANKDREVYLPYVSTALNNLGVLYSDLNRLEEARKAYEEALKNYRQLAVQNPAVYLPDVAMTLTNLGVLHSDENRMQDAREAYREAAQIQLSFVATNPDGFLPLLAQTLEDLGTIEVKTSNFEAAPVLFAEALAALKRLASLGRPQNSEKIAQTASKLAVSYNLAGKIDNAVPAAREALSLIDALGPTERNSLDREILLKILYDDPPVPKPADFQPDSEGENRTAGLGGGFVPPAAESRPLMSAGFW